MACSEAATYRLRRVKISHRAVQPLRFQFSSHAVFQRSFAFLIQTAMEEMKYSPLSNTSTTTTTADGNREQGTSSMLSRVKKDCFAFGVSLQEGFRYVKATLVGLAKKLKARDEQEAAIADLQAQKMQVKAADEAEDTKKKKYKST